MLRECSKSVLWDAPAVFECLEEMGQELGLILLGLETGRMCFRMHPANADLAVSEIRDAGQAMLNLIATSPYESVRDLLEEYPKVSIR